MSKRRRRRRRKRNWIWDPIEVQFRYCVLVGVHGFLLLDYVGSVYEWISHLFIYLSVCLTTFQCSAFRYRRRRGRSPLVLEITDNCTSLHGGPGTPTYHRHFSVAATAMKMKKSSCGFVCGDDFAGGTEIKMGSYCDT